MSYEKDLEQLINLRLPAISVNTETPETHKDTETKTLPTTVKQKYTLKDKLNRYFEQGKPTLTRAHSVTSLMNAVKLRLEHQNLVGAAPSPKRIYSSILEQKTIETQLTTSPKTRSFETKYIFRPVSSSRVLYKFNSPTIDRRKSNIFIDICVSKGP